MSAAASCASPSVCHPGSPRRRRRVPGALHRHAWRTPSPAGPTASRLGHDAPARPPAWAVRGRATTQGRVRMGGRATTQGRGNPGQGPRPGPGPGQGQGRARGQGAGCEPGKAQQSAQMRCRACAWTAAKRGERGQWCCESVNGSVTCGLRAVRGRPTVTRDPLEKSRCASDVKRSRCSCRLLRFVLVRRRVVTCCSQVQRNARDTGDHRALSAATACSTSDGDVSSWPVSHGVGPAARWRRWPITSSRWRWAAQMT